MNSNVKRKFNALLHGLGNRSSPSLGTVATVDAPDDDPTAAALFALDYGHGNGNASPRAKDPSRPATAMAPDSTLSGNPFPSTAITTPSTLTSATAATPKKRRVGAPTSIPLRSSFGRPGVMVTTTTNVTFTKKTPARPPAGSASPTPATAHAPPRYCPGDRDQLIRRLATFQDLTEWTPKPERVSEVEWARRGWELSGRERVRCALCGKELVVKLNRKDVGGGREVPVLIASDIEDAVVERYAELIVASHGDQCLWRKKGCDAFLLRLPLASPKLALEGLRERYHQLCERNIFLPYEFNLRLPEHFNVDTIVKSLPRDFFSNPPSPFLGTAPTASSPDSHSTHPPEPNHEPPPPPINHVALALALLGWQGLTNPRTSLAVPNSAGCNTCLRRLGLWMFRSREVNPDTNRILVSAPMDHLDPVLEHRFFCPWKSGVAQRSHSGVAGAGAGATARRFLLASSPSRETSGTVGTVGGDAAGGEPEKITGAPHGQDMPGWEILMQVLKNEAFVRERVVAVAKKKSFLHGRSKSAAVPGTTRGNGAAVATDPTSPGAVPVTAGRERRSTMANGSKPANSHHVEELEQEGGGGEDETEEVREEKEKAMMSRLRRVKSLFNVKGGSGRLRRMTTGASSRPGMGHSSRSALGGS